ncbi:MAG TPA: nucleotide exchange factor GrpE [Candidatus Dormibacteraeota bacterium]
MSIPPTPDRAEDEDAATAAEIQDAFLPAEAETDEGTPAAAGADMVSWAGPQAALEDLQARHLRLSADFDNFRRRSAREAGDRARYAAEDVARALLPVLDNLQRAIDHAPQDTSAEFLDGLTHTVRQFEEALASVGVMPIDAEGQPFDPNLHEAVMGEESGSVDVDTVVADLRRGYRLHDRVLRPSMVKVAHPAHAATEA